MNVSQMMRGLLGEAVAGETRTMELKTGQVVRGVVLQVMENNEALVNINGVQVRAKLELPLQAGQSAMLQVQPESNGSLIVLKGADPGTSALLEDTLRDHAKQLGLPDQKWAVELVKNLRAEGFPFNRATAAAFQQAVAVMPPGENVEQWMNAAATAFKRGLPMTAATIASVGQTMHGTSVHELLNALERQLGALQRSGGERISPETRQGIERLLGLLKAGDALLQSGASDARAGVAGSANGSAGTAPQPGQAAAGSALSGGAAGAATQNAAGQQPAAASGAQAPALSGPQGAQQGLAAVNAGAQPASATAAQPASATAVQTGAAAANTGAAQSAASESPAASGGATGQAGAAGQVGQAASNAAPGNWLGQMMKWLGVDHELQLARATSAGDNSAAQGTMRGLEGATQAGTAASAAQPQASQSAAGQAAPAAQGQQQSGAGAAAGQGAAGMPAQDARQGEAAPQARPQAAAGDAAQQAGAARDASAMRAGNAASVVPPGGQLAPAGDSLPGVPHAQGHGPGGPGAAPIAAQESLKSALMMLAGSNDIPPAVKETVQSLINHITGQQLLLSPERNSSLFTHVTMFIPLKDQDGGGTASVHIQTRRGRKGELDAENCRLLFNLSMKALGDTLVDVQITDKIVSLNLWNDHPAMGALLEESRAEMSERLLETGYQLSSLRNSPFPAPGEQLDVPTESAAKRQSPPDASQFASTRYKGVDFRV